MKIFFLLILPIYLFSSSRAHHSIERRIKRDILRAYKGELHYPIPKAKVEYTTPLPIIKNSYKYKFFFAYEHFMLIERENFFQSHLTFRIGYESKISDLLSIRFDLNVIKMDVSDQECDLVREKIFSQNLGLGLSGKYFLQSHGRMTPYLGIGTSLNYLSLLYDSKQYLKVYHLKMITFLGGEYSLSDRMTLSAEMHYQKIFINSLFRRSKDISIDFRSLRLEKLSKIFARSHLLKISLLLMLSF